MSARAISCGGADTKYPIKIIGVHPVVAQQPCYLIELEIGERSRPFNWGDVTQEAPAQSRANWQVAYDETPLNVERTYWAFFFHYLDLSKPLLTPSGPLAIPAPSSLPEHLRHLQCIEP